MPFVGKKLAYGMCLLLSNPC